MARIESSSLPNGLPLHRVELPGPARRPCSSPSTPARAPSAPRRTGWPTSSSISSSRAAQKYDDYRKVNQTAETMGAVLNAYTSHDLVAFHITCRAEVVAEAIDLLTDFVGRPKIDAEELDRERGVVIQEIARAHDQPSVRRRAPDRPRGVRRSPARAPRARARRSTCARSRARRSSAFRARQWAGARGGAFLVGNLEHLPEDGELAELFGRFPSISANGAFEPAPGVRADDAGRGARVQPVAPADVLPAGDRRRATRASAPRSASTRRCWAARWARGCSTRSASSAAWRTRSTRSTTRSPTCRSCSSRPGWSPASASRRTRACARSSTSCAPTGRPRTRSSARAPTPPAGACWRSRTRTPSPATRPPQTVVFGQDIDPDEAIAALDGVTFDEVDAIAAGISEALSVACVGPHETSEFTT